MKRENAKELIPIIQAYANGEDVEYYDSGVWFLCGNTTSFAQKPNEYRIKLKLKLKLIPFTFEDSKLFKDKWIKRRASEVIYRVCSFAKMGIDTNNAGISYENLLANYTFEDGSPCGKYINE